MDKRKQNAARPQGFRGNYGAAQAKAREASREEAPKKKKAAPKSGKQLRKKVTKRRVQREGNRKKIAVFAAAVLAAILLAGGVIWIVVANANKTVHMLPEIYDIQTPEPTASAVSAGEGMPESLDNFIAEGVGA